MTQDQRQFLRVTKRVPFRSTRLVIRSITNKCSFFIYNTLYKIGVVEKFTQEDNTRREERTLHRSGQFKFRSLTCAFEAKIFKDVFFSVEYFHKKGDTLNRLYTVKDEYTERYVMVLRPVNVGVHVNGKTYTSDLPVLKVIVPPKVMNYAPGSYNEFRTMELDMTSVKKYMVMAPLSTLDEAEVNATYDALKDKTIKVLSKINYTDLEVKR